MWIYRPFRREQTPQRLRSPFRPGRAKPVNKPFSGCFTPIAGVYDLNNTLLSFGLHYRWKTITASYVPVTTGGRALDVGSGTADLALLIEPRMGAGGRVIASDLNHAMLVEGLKKVTARGLGERITCLEANAEHLGFPDRTFHAVTTGFCMRNVGDLQASALGHSPYCAARWAIRLPGVFTAGLWLAPGTVRLVLIPASSLDWNKSGA
jgi:Methylase involved in ubiquinone/menaquinone biosynthesis